MVREFIEAQRRERAEDVAYSRMQSTRPQTVAHWLTDSPAGLAAWIVDLFRSFGDCGGDLEEPQLLAEELRAFFRPLRPGARLERI